MMTREEWDTTTKTLYDFTLKTGDDMVKVRVWARNRDEADSQVKALMSGGYEVAR